MDAKIATFCLWTRCADPAKARVFLDSFDGDLDAAITAYLGTSLRLPTSDLTSPARR